MKALNKVDASTINETSLSPLSLSIGNEVLSGQDTARKKLDGRRDDFHVFSSLIAGLASGTISATVCAPLDLVRTRMQVLGEVVSAQQFNAADIKGRFIVLEMFRDIVQKDGVAGCFRGLTATLLTVPTFWGAYFSFYDYFKRKWSRRFPEQNLSLVHLGSAITAGAISDLLCNPMFVVRTRLQTESLHRHVNYPQVLGSTQRTIVQTMQLLYAEGGFFIFWRGMSANLLGLSHVAVQFPLYEKLKTILIADKNERQATTTQLLLASGISKMSASLLTYPHEVIRSRMMDIRSIQGIGFFETCRRIYVSEGIVGFYAGLSVSLVRVIPNTMLTFLVYERTLSLIGSL